MDISVVIPVYNEKKSIPLLYESLVSSLDKLYKDYEIVFVDDASCDGSHNLLEGFQKQDQNIKVIHLLKKSGQMRAIAEGVKNARGQTIILMDGDLQYDPFEIKLFVEKINCGYDAVGGVRIKRFDPFFRICISKLANFLINKMLKSKINDLGCSFNAFKRYVFKRAFLKEGKNILLTKPLMVKYSNNFTEIKVSHLARIHGKSQNGFLDLVVLFVKNIRMFSFKKNL